MNFALAKFGRATSKLFVSKKHLLARDHLDVIIQQSEQKIKQFQLFTFLILMI